MNVGTELFVWCEWSYNLHSNLIQRSVWLILRTFIIIIIIIKHEKLCYVFFFYYSWLRHPRIRENWKTVTAAFLLFVAGIGMKIRFQLLHLIKFIEEQGCRGDESIILSPSTGYSFVLTRGCVEPSLLFLPRGMHLYAAQSN